jgi:uncharacterized protein (TIGR03086 family)
MHDPIEILSRTNDAVAAIIETQPEPRSETPCPEWTYAQLLGHLVGGDRLFVGLLTGRAAAPARPRMAPDPDRPPPTPADYREWSARLVDILRQPAVQSATHSVPVGELTGSQVVVLRSVEHLVHGWDLAKAAGAATTDLRPVAEVLDRPARQLLAAVGETVLANRRPFEEAVEVAGDEPVLDRLVAAFGRDPGWEPDPAAGYARLKERFAGHEDVELPDGTRRGYGAEGLRVRDQVFACPHKGRLMIKLPEEEVDELIGSGRGRPLAKPGQRPMREWVLVPFDGAAAARADRAYTFVSGREG